MSYLLRIARRSEVLQLADLDRMAVRIVEAEYALSPCPPCDGMAQVHMAWDPREGRVNILALEIQKKIAPPMC